MATCSVYSNKKEDTSRLKLDFYYPWVHPQWGWNKKAPYGVCPACGAKGVETVSKPDLKGFQCTRPNCYTIYPKIEPYLHGKPLRTHWYDPVRGEDDNDRSRDRDAQAVGEEVRS